MPRGPRRNFRAAAGEIVTVQPADGNRDLTDRLAGVHEIRDTLATRHISPDGLDRLDQPGVGRHPGERDEGRPAPSHEGADRLGIHSAFRQVGRADDLDSPSAGEGEVHDLVRGVVGPARENRVTGGEVEGLERLGECGRRVLGEGDVPRFGAQKPAHLVVDGSNLGLARLESLVAAQLVLQPEVRDHRFVDGLGRKRGTGVIEVDSSGAARRVEAPLINHLATTLSALGALVRPIQA